jgi:hypothetical protein
VGLYMSRAYNSTLSRGALPLRADKPHLVLLGGSQVMKEKQVRLVNEGRHMKVCWGVFRGCEPH